MNDVPVIGKFYMVPAIQVVDWYHFAGFIPIIGYEHEDSEIINFPAMHFHIDWGFISERAMRHCGPVGHRRYGIIVQRQAHAHRKPPRNDGELLAIGEPVLKRMKYKRRMEPFPHSIAKWTKPLHEKYACARLINGACPHRGVLASQMISDGDTLVCPGHGLRFDRFTGRVVPPEQDQP